MAIFDKKTFSLKLSRDRFGEKPLYYHDTGKNFYFASEPKAIFALIGKRLPQNLNKVRQYLVYGYKSLYKNDECFFEDEM